MNLLKDKEFLKKLDLKQNKEIFAKIIALTFEELPIERIEGKITGGSINIDGTSTVRRTCSIQMVAKDVNINNFYWGLSNKFQVEIGIKNDVDNSYPEIIWFPQGKFVITDFNTSLSVNSYNISISGRDKMCLLNGDLAGSLPSSIDFGKIETYDNIFEEVKIAESIYRAGEYYIYNQSNGEYEISYSRYDENIIYYQKSELSNLTSLPLKTIIREALHTYGNEPYHNIIINDLDECGLELMEYRGDTPIYFLYRDGEAVNATTNGEIECMVHYPTGDRLKTLQDLAENEIYNLVDGFSKEAVNVSFPSSKNPSDIYQIAKIEYGQTSGYRITDLTYAGELVSGIGESLTSILDKIKNMLGDFEYFYDLDGRFIFQKKQTYINTAWSSMVKTGDDQYVSPAALTSAVTYNFKDNILITSFQNTPDIKNLKNDFSVWGEKENFGVKIPIHARVAVDKKPEKYNSIQVSKEDIENYKGQFPDLFPLKTEKYVQDSILYSVEDWDWREIIYQMAKDYYKFGQVDDFYFKIMEANPGFKEGKTGYEQYYIDLQGFWRMLYDPNLPKKYETSGGYYTNQKNWINESLGTYELEKVWVAYTVDEDNFTCDYYIPVSQSGKTQAEIDSMTTAERTEFFKVYSDEYAYWNKMILEEPENLIFWLDFLDGLDNSSIPAIGDRPKAINDKDVSAIYFRETPNIIFLNQEESFTVTERKSGYNYFNIQPAMESLFTISGQGKSAKSRIDELIYDFVCCTESITLTTLPIYYLQPNTRIFVYDENSNINGDYIINKMTIPLTYNGTMSISAVKAVERLY